MHIWTVVRYLHLLGLIFFVGGQLMLVVAVAPAVRRHGTEEAMRTVARRFGVASGVALAVIVASGVAMASHYSLWHSSVLRTKLVLVVLVFVLTALHAVAPRARLLSLATLVVSLAIVWLGLKLTYG